MDARAGGGGGGVILGKRQGSGLYCGDGEGWAGLDWAGLGWAGLGWAAGRRADSARAEAALAWQSDARAAEGTSMICTNRAGRTGGRAAGELIAASAACLAAAAARQAPPYHLLREPAKEGKHNYYNKRRKEDGNRERKANTRPGTPTRTTHVRVAVAGPTRQSPKLHTKLTSTEGRVKLT
ncbi:hypothetical protein BDZ91DRAFT_832091 [Kalaharituber pfeilii]|nr:hypothetical protein BDZ91DRAFT_832091 [Kalaharituber pfeilii]